MEYNTVQTESQFFWSIADRRPTRMTRVDYGFRWTPKSPTEALFELAFKQFDKSLLRQARQMGVYLTSQPHRQREVGEFTVYEWDLKSVNFNELWML